MAGGSMDMHSGSSASAQSSLRTDMQTAEDYSFLIWREIFRAIVRNEKQALESSRTVELEVEVRQSDSPCSVKERIIKIEVICEPGKPPRLRGA